MTLLYLHRRITQSYTTASRDKERNEKEASERRRRILKFKNDPFNFILHIKQPDKLSIKLTIYKIRK